MARAPLRVHFVGGNGLPIQSYAPFLKALEEGNHLQCTRTDLSVLSPLAANADISRSDTGVWEAATKLIIRDIESARDADGGDGTPGGVIGIGHSLGGALTLCAQAQAAPGLFSRVLVIDPPMFHAQFRFAWLVLNKLGLMPRFQPLAARARKRRSVFDSHEHVKIHYTGRGTFAEWDAECIALFAEHGVKQRGGGNEDPGGDGPAGQDSGGGNSDGEGSNAADGGGGEDGGGGVSLRFTPDLEAAFFAETPTEVDWVPKRWNPTPWLGQYDRPSVPGDYIYSTNHLYTSKADVAWLKARLGSQGRLKFHPVDHGHFFPLEVPRVAAKHTQDLLLLPNPGAH